MAGCAVTSGGCARPAGAQIAETLDVATAWSGHPVGFFLLTHGDRQFVAFYDHDRQMTIAARSLGQRSWRLARLGSTIGWDSHNYITMAIDGDGYLHVAGNMHSAPLLYFRTTRRLDIRSFERVASMIGRNEQSCTYPQFFRGPSGDLVFAYRDGVSGRGNHIFNVYDRATRTWRRLLDTPLIDGEGLRNAYPVGPVPGPDGFWHLVWVWRDTPDAGTNHDLSYARSPDLVRWETGAGRALTLPITLATAVIVDPVPVGAGMINNNTKIGFDSRKRPVVAYHKYDQDGNTQLFNARLEDGRWVRYQTSDWAYRWAFGGGGTLVFEIEVDGVQSAPDGLLTQRFYHVRHGRRAFRLDEATLKPLATFDPPTPHPAELERVESSTPGMLVRWAADAGRGPDPGVRYMLRWETLESNRDRPRATVPPPTTLRVYGFRSAGRSVQ